MKKAFLFIALLFFITVYADNTWQLSKEEDGIQVFARESSQSSVNSFKGVAQIPANLSTVVAALSDTNLYSQLLHKCKSATLLKEVDPRQSYKYIVTNMPWPVKDRDTVVHSVLTQDVASKQVTIQMKATSGFVAVNKEMIRIQHMLGRWVLTPKSKYLTRVEYEVSVDPEGNLPKWLVNTLAVDNPFFTLKNLRKHVNRLEYKTENKAHITNF